MGQDFRQFNETHMAETYKSMITVSTEVFKGLILVNGGAAAGMVAALDKLSRLVSQRALQISMGSFLLGLTCVLAACICGYFVQSALHEENMERGTEGDHVPWREAAIAFAILSLLLFVAGGMTITLAVGSSTPLCAS